MLCRGAAVCTYNKQAVLLPEVLIVSGTSIVSMQSGRLTTCHGFNVAKLPVLMEWFKRRGPAVEGVSIPFAASTQRRPRPPSGR